MRSNGLATVLLMVPVLTVPALAIFGIPQFAPVVASPLDEGQDYDRESRVGNSARHSSRDDLFGDVEGFGSESDEEPVQKKRKSSLSGSHRRASNRRSKDSDSSASSWGDDLSASSTSSDWPGKRRPSSFNSDDLQDQDSMPISKSPKRSSAVDKASRDKQRPFQNAKNDDAVRLASTADLDGGVTQAGFDDDNQFEGSRSSIDENRMRGSDTRRTKRRESSTEPLSWAAAVERLNQFEIRNFRLEPGRQLGQFVFICVYTPPDNPSVMHRFEAEADQPLKAVENVLDQIVEWQQRR